MAYNIKKNEYVKPTEVREVVVQRLIDYFTRGLHTIWNEFCPNVCWRKHRAIGINRYGDAELVGGTTQAPWEIKDQLTIHTCEMKEFFKVWLENGYHISKGTYSVRGNTAILYKFTEKPYTDYGYRPVTEFTENLD